MGLSSNIHAIAESPLDINPDRRRMMMSALFKMQSNTPAASISTHLDSLTFSRLNNNNNNNNSHNPEIDEVDEESFEVQKSITFHEADVDQSPIINNKQEQSDHNTSLKNTTTFKSSSWIKPITC